MNRPEVVYTAEATATGGRDGRTVSSDGVLNLKLSVPRQMGRFLTGWVKSQRTEPSSPNGTNPEQLFAATYSSCFLEAIKVVAPKLDVEVPADAKVTAKVGIGPIGEAFALDVELDVSLPGLDQGIAQALVQKAHRTCPYSNAMRNNVDVRLRVTE